MVKVKTPLFNELRGSIETHINTKTFKTYSDKRKIVLLSNKPVPTDRKTEAQLAQRSLFRQAIDAWKQLSDEEKQQYKQEAAANGLTGYQYFIKQFLLNPPPAEEIIWFEDFDTAPTMPPYSNVFMQGAITFESSKAIFPPATASPDTMLLLFTAGEAITPPFIFEVKVTNVLDNIQFHAGNNENLDEYVTVTIDYINQKITFNETLYGSGYYSEENVTDLTDGTIKIIIDETSATVLINGEQKASFTSEELSGYQFPYFGVTFVRTDTNPYNVEIDYFKVTKP